MWRVWCLIWLTFVCLEIWQRVNFIHYSPNHKIKFVTFCLLCHRGSYNCTFTLLLYFRSILFDFCTSLTNSNIYIYFPSLSTTLDSNLENVSCTLFKSIFFFFYFLPKRATYWVNLLLNLIVSRIYILHVRSYVTWHETDDDDDDISTSTITHTHVGIISIAWKTVINFCTTCESLMQWFYFNFHSYHHKAVRNMREYLLLVCRCTMYVHVIENLHFGFYTILVFVCEKDCQTDICMVYSYGKFGFFGVFYSMRIEWASIVDDKPESGCFND